MNLLFRNRVINNIENAIREAENAHHNDGNCVETADI